MSARRAAALPALAAALALALPAAPAASFDADSARTKAHALSPVLLRGEAGPLWGEFDGTMRAALTDSVSWAATIHSIVNSLGALDSIRSEEVTTLKAGTFIVDAHCVFAKSPAPIEMIFAFDTDGRVTGLLFRPDESTPRTEHASQYLGYTTKAAIRLPCRGEWYVLWGGRSLAQNYHAFTRDQRFATDLLMVKDGHSHRGDGKALTDYYCWDQPVLAPAAGTVVWARDSVPDNAPGHMDPAHPTGNSLILDLGGGEYLLLAHMRPGSLRYTVGDHVPADAEVGRCGNSGNTTEPHIHVHLQNGPPPFDADGLPLQFVDFVADGRPVARGEPQQGQRVQRAEPSRGGAR